MGETGLGGRGDAPVPFVAALIILERNPRRDELPLAVKVLEKIQAIEDEPKEIVEKVVEENGASL